MAIVELMDNRFPAILSPREARKQAPPAKSS